MKKYQRNILVLYPLTVFIGSLIHTFYPLPDTVFSNKHNPLNQHFAKRGWAWTGFSLAIFIYFSSPAPRRLRAAYRWFLATLYWIVFAQWAFGHSVFDRVLMVSGTCSIDGHGHPRVCKANGGEWMGFDVSGHCFLLIHMSLFIYEELQILVPPPQPTAARRPTNVSNTFLPHPTTTAIMSSTLLFLLLLWYTMLIATSVYFHSWQEKVAGTFAGMAYWLLSYVIVWPAWFPEMMPRGYNQRPA
ncbi:fat storage-inducing transmembrane protein 2 [Geranomyces variabilis]|nr:fat storage-inducing transmembrane protein 2 [Geranomyces variabilis]